MRSLILKSFWLLLLSWGAGVSTYAEWAIDYQTLHLSPPPAVGFRGEDKDFEIMLDYQDKRTAEECRAADQQTYAGMKNLFGSAPGLLSAEEFAQVEAFGKKVLWVAVEAARPFKGQWTRVRPYDANRGIRPCVRRPGGQRSYPSTHAAMGVLMGDLLARIYPAKKAELLKHGFQIGENRVLGGVHHPTDVTAGRELGQQILAELLKDAEFAEDLKTLKLKACDRLL